jgi:phosphoribosyl 1,2-cyclic phosphodiesterase
MTAFVPPPIAGGVAPAAAVRVQSLASGSSGNALLIDAGHTRLLVDCGVSSRRIEAALARLGVPVASLDGVLITHEHVDHVAGLPVLGRRHGLTFTMTRGTARAIPGIERVAYRIVPRGATFAVGRATVTALPVRHDAAETVGYAIEVAGATIAVLTDLGYPEAHLREPLARADLIVLEANHDLDRLWGGRYPWPIKQRIAGPDGHLCNDDCAALLTGAIDDRRARTVWLAHLSVENNDEQTARAAVERRLEGRALAVRVLPRETPGPLWTAPAAPA